MSSPDEDDIRGLLSDLAEERDLPPAPPARALTHLEVIEEYFRASLTGEAAELGARRRAAATAIPAAGWESAVSLVRAAAEQERAFSALKRLVKDVPTSDPHLTTLIDELLGSSDKARASEGVYLAGFLARGSAAMAARIAARARRDRNVRFAERPRGLAFAVAESRRPELAPTAWLELAETRDLDWGYALVATAGDPGAKYLLRRMRDLGWSAMVVDIFVALRDQGEPVRRTLLSHPDPFVRLRAADLREDAAVLASMPSWQRRPPRSDKEQVTLDLPLAASPLEACTSDYADLRRRALSHLDVRPDFLGALLLATALDRHLAQRDGARWTPPGFGEWGAILMGLRQGQRTNALVAHDGLNAVIAEKLLLDAIDAGTFPAWAQTMTPDLEELKEIGVERFAERYPPPAGLTPEELAAFDREEAAFAATVT